MYKTVLFILSLLSADGVAAKEVDARNPQNVVPTPLALAIADTGISSDSWILSSSTSNIVFVHDAEALETLNKISNELNRKIRKSLTQQLELKLIETLN